MRRAEAGHLFWQQQQVAAAAAARFKKTTRRKATTTGSAQQRRLALREYRRPAKDMRSAARAEFSGPIATDGTDGGARPSSSDFGGWRSVPDGTKYR